MDSVDERETGHATNEGGTSNCGFQVGGSVRAAPVYYRSSNLYLIVNPVKPEPRVELVQAEVSCLVTSVLLNGCGFCSATAAALCVGWPIFITYAVEGTVRI